MNTTKTGTRSAVLDFGSGSILPWITEAENIVDIDAL